MITGELKNKIDGLWDVFAAGGLVNPLEVIEQITYLMFIHDLDDSDNKRAKESAMLGLPFKSIFSEEVKIGDRTIDGSQLKWSVFHDYPADRMYTVMQEWVFPFIKTLHSDKDSAYSKYMDDAIFKLPTPLVLDKVVSSLDNIYELMKRYYGNVLLIHGSADSIIPLSSAQKAQENFPHAKLIVIEGAEHGFHGPEREEVIQMAVDFIKKESGLSSCE